MKRSSCVRFQMGAALLRRPLLTVSGGLYCFIFNNYPYLITFRLLRLTVEEEALVGGTVPPA
jgi:hypothetical protein